MSQIQVPARNEIPVEYTWDATMLFPDDRAWEEAYDAILEALPTLDSFRGRLGESPAVLADWFDRSSALLQQADIIFVYAFLFHEVNTTDQAASARIDRAIALGSRVREATTFAGPEILDVGRATLDRWMDESPRLRPYAHYFDSLFSRQKHIRSVEVEALLEMVGEPFYTASQTASTLVDADLQFEPARDREGKAVPVLQGNIDSLLHHEDRELRRTAWESYADGHLAVKHTLANALAAGVKQNVFLARARDYPSSLEAALAPNHIPVEVFHNLLATVRRHLPIWHRYWEIRRRALGYETQHVYDVKAPLARSYPEVPFEQAVEWICEGMAPLGEEYVATMRRGLLEERWVDLYPSKGKRSGAFSAGAPGSHPFILMSYTDDLDSLSTLAHELGHSMHSYYTWQEQPQVYTSYSMFVAEVASNFNQALVRAHLLEQSREAEFQIALIEEAMSNFHRYFFIMPTLARFELELHERAERGEGLTAGGMIELMAELFREGYGNGIEVDQNLERIGITWAPFQHLYANFYVFQYATGISGAHALAEQVRAGDPQAAERYLTFLKAGSSRYPLDALQQAGVDLTEPAPVEAAFGVLEDLVDRLDQLLTERRT